MRITSQTGFGGTNESITMQETPKTAATMTNFKISADGSLTKRRGIANVATTYGQHIDNLWSGSIGNEEAVIFAANGTLYSVTAHESPCVPTIIGAIESGENMMFGFDGTLYIKTATKYYKYNGEKISEVEGYIPCVAISCTPSGEGTLLDQINLICDKRRQLFSGDGTSVLYQLAETDIDEVISIKVDGSDYTKNYSVEAEKGRISFEAGPAPGLNNVEIIYSKAIAESDRQRFFKCTRMMLFGGNSDGRAFFWGNPDYPNYRFHTDLADGIPSVEYFPVNAFTVIGNRKITCITQQYNKQLIFTENEAFFSYCELKDDGLGNTFSSFPVYSLNGCKGCLIETDGCVIDNRPVTLCDDGLNMWESTSVENEKNAVCFSGAIKKSLDSIVGLPSKKYLFDFQANREFYFIWNDLAFVYNYDNRIWYKYDGFTGEHYSVLGKTLYFSKNDTLYAFGYDIGRYNSDECVWRSNPITAGQADGLSDITEFEADMYIQGPITVRFDFKKNNSTEHKIRTFVFTEKDDRHTRIGFRPALKRAMPFDITIYTSGSGECTIRRIMIKTREKERSRRNGLL